MTDDTRPIEETMIIPRMAARLDAVDAREAAFKAKYETTPPPRGGDTQMLPRTPEDVEEALKIVGAPWFAGSMAARDQANQEATGAADQTVLDLGDGLRPVGLYDSMVRTAGTYAHQLLLQRLAEARGIDRTVDYGRRRAMDRLCYATHLLTGPVLLRISSAMLPSTTVSGRLIEQALCWPRFVANPAQRHDVVRELAKSPVSTLLRVTLLDLIRMLQFGDPAFDRISSLVLSAMSQVGRFDATGGAEMVDLVVSCRIPPVVPGEVRD